MKIKNIAIGGAITVLILIFGFLGLMIDTSMQEQLMYENYNQNSEVSRDTSAFPTTAYSKFNYEYDVYGQEKVTAKIGEQIGAKMGANIGAKIGDKVDQYGNTVAKSPEFPESPGESSSYDAGQKLIKDARLDFTVVNYDNAYDRVSNIAAGAGGYVSDSKESVYKTKDYTRKGGYIIIRIPAEKFNSAVLQIKEVGELTNKEITVQDVTQEYLDLSARLKNAIAEEEGFLKIMENATTVEDMLMVEKEIGRVRGNIEQMQGQINYMNNRINLATIHVNMQEPIKEEPYTPPARKWGIREAVDTAFDGFLSTTRGIIIISGVLLPILIVFIFSYFIYKKLKKKERKVAKKNN